MSRITWNDSYSVGIEEIDAQHKKWIAIINELHDSLIEGRQLTEIGMKSLQAMEEYAVFHFDFEEQYMERIGYTDLPHHKREHEMFLEKIRGIIRETEEGHLVLNTQIMKILTSWLTEHIQGSDKKYSM
ncbi:MAG: bacteriohemerythrin [Thermodesulfobacteriota bacterium]